MEEQEDYVTEAMELLHGPSVEIEPARTTIERRAGEFREVEKPAFVKISTAFKSELPDISGDALKVWLFISLSVNRNTGKANPGLRTIASGVKLAVNTVQKAIKELESLKLLEVRRDQARYNIYEVPEYVSANRAEPTVSNGDTPPETVSNSTEAVSNSMQTVSPSVILNQRNQNKPDLLDAELHYHLQPKALKDAFSKHFKLTPNWEAKYNRQFMEWLVEAKATPDQVERAAKLWGSDRRFNWTVPTLKGIQEHWLELIGGPHSTDESRPEYQPIQPDTIQAVPNPLPKPRLP